MNCTKAKDYKKPFPNALLKLFFPTEYVAEDESRIFPSKLNIWQWSLVRVLFALVSLLATRAQIVSFLEGTKTAVGSGKTHRARIELQT